MKTKLTFTKIDLTKRYYMTDLDGERMGNYKALEEIKKTWMSSDVSSDGNGNVGHECCFDLPNGEIKWDCGFDGLRMSNILTSQLLLYRLICVFNTPPIAVRNPYKTIWWFCIKHKSSGKILTFGEWKGAAGFWLPEGTHKQLKPNFKQDLEWLLLFLVSDQIPHPYDGCTAGQIA